MPGTPVGLTVRTELSPAQSPGTVCPVATVPAVVRSARQATSCCSAPGTRRRWAQSSAAAGATTPPSSRVTVVSRIVGLRMFACSWTASAGAMCGRHTAGCDRACVCHRHIATPGHCVRARHGSPVTGPLRFPHGRRHRDRRAEQAVPRLHRRERGRPRRVRGRRARAVRAGKTTLFNLLTGFLKPTGGQIRLHGREVAGSAPERIARLGVARSFQITSLFEQLTLRRHLELALLAASRHRYRFWASDRALAGFDDRAAELLDEVGLADLADAEAHTLARSEEHTSELQSR